MNTLKEAAQQALEYMKSVGKMDMHPEEWAIVNRLEAALAEPVQEPTKAMIDAAERIDWSDADVRGNIINMWQAMIAAAPQPAEPVQEPVAKVELMTTGGNAGLATRIVEIDDHLRERLRPGQLLYTAPPQRPAQPVQEPASKMTAGRAAYFMARFKREEKMLGPNEQAALDFVISMLEAALAEPVQEPVQEPVAWECKAGGLRRLTQRQYEAQPDNIKRHYTRIEPVQEALTIERLRDALVASRIVPPAAVEDPDEYDDGVTLHRIEALHRRLA